VLETAKRLDWEQNPSYPVLFSIPEAEFAIEAKFYLLTEAAGASQLALMVKNLPANAGDARDLCSIPA